MGGDFGVRVEGQFANRRTHLQTVHHGLIGNCVLEKGAGGGEVKKRPTAGKKKLLRRLYFLLLPSTNGIPIVRFKMLFCFNIAQNCVNSL